MATICDDNPQLAIIYFDYSLSAMNIICAVSMIPLVYIYTKAYIESNLKSSRRLFVAGLIFFIIVFSLYISRTVWSLVYCNDAKLYETFTQLSLRLYSLHTVILLGILFYRLYTVFTGTAYHLKSWQIKMYLVIYVLTWILLIYSNMEAFKYAATGKGLAPYNISIMMGGMTFLFILISTLFLVGLYVHKLVQVHKQAAQNDKLIVAITKTSLLCLISTINGLLTAVFVMLMLAIQSMHWWMITQMITITDIYTNFLCIFLSYRYFHEWYMKLCGCCDAACHRFWIKRMSMKEVPELEIVEEPTITMATQS
eukprot:383202_1